MRRNVRSRLAGLVCLLLLAAACGGPEAEPGHRDTTTTTTGGADAADVYEGHYSSGFEVSAFVACGSDEQWWVVGSEELTSKVEEAAPSDPQYSPVFVRVRGELSEPGTYGHMGAYTRELTVTDVLDVSAEEQC